MDAKVINYKLKHEIITRQVVREEMEKLRKNKSLGLEETLTVNQGPLLTMLSK